MPLHKGRKSRLVTTADVVLQQLTVFAYFPVGQVRGTSQRTAEVMAKQRVEG
jgi:hypothetical protein